MTDIPLWKIKIAVPLELDTVLFAADAVPEATPETAAVRGMQLQRIDRTEGATVVFASTSEDGVRAFARIVADRTRSGAPHIAKADQRALHARDAIRT